MLYIKETVSYKVIKLAINIKYLPSISVKAKREGEAPSIVSTTYREWTGGVSGLDSASSQKERHSCQLVHWIELNIVGDVNIDYKKWSSTNDQQQTLIDQIKHLQTTTGLEQIVEDDTRFQQIGNAISSACLDHVYTNCAQKLQEVQLHQIGDSDQHCTITKKYSTLTQEHPRSFTIENFY